MAHLPLVSIIIPTYNNADVVCQAVDCALTQRGIEGEVIVVDDGSTDGTGELIRERFGERVVYLRQENRGAGGARNTGIRRATGKYLQFLDADDLLDPQKVQVQVEALQKMERPGVCYCDYVKCDLDDIGTHFDAAYMSPKLSERDPLHDLILKWEIEVSIPIHCFLFETALFKESGITFDEALPANEDWDCWVTLFCLKPGVVYVDRVLAYYRMRKNSRCSDLLRMRRSHLIAVEKQIARNRGNLQIVELLKERKRAIRFRYRDVGLTMRMLNCVHPSVKRWYQKNVPWRIQRLLD